MAAVKRIRVEVPVDAFPEMRHFFSQIPQKSQGFFVGMLIQAGLQSETGKHICSVLRDEAKGAEYPAQKAPFDPKRFTKSMLGDFE